MESLIKVKQFLKISFDFENISEARLHAFLESVKIENNAPESQLVLKKSLLKRDGGKFSSLKESTAVLSMDMMLYLFDWALLGKNQLTDPKVTINC